MFTAIQIKEMMDAEPFKPFRIHLSDGKSYEVQNHDAALVSRNSVEIGVHPDPDGIAERFVNCAIMHITQIEEMQAA